MAKLLAFFGKKNNLLATIIILLILGLGSTVYFQHKKIVDINGKHQAEQKLNAALNDTVSYYQNAYGEEVAVKLTLQASIKTLEERNADLSDSEKELLARVKQVETDKDIIAAALIEARIRIKELEGTGPVVVTDTSVTFFSADTAKHFTYEIEIGEVRRLKPLVKPTILFKSLEFPNKQFIEFDWGERKEGYPIEFSVSNSNPNYRVYDISSYVIPELKKEVVDPSGWQKVGQWFKRNGKKIVYIGAGAAIGAGGTYVLMK